MIKSFKGKFAETISRNRKVPKGFPPDIATVARRKLAMANAAVRLDDLRSPPGNRLEALKGDLIGKHSIRISGKWRLIFRWTDSGPDEVEIVDYHD